MNAKKILCLLSAGTILTAAAPAFADPHRWEPRHDRPPRAEESGRGRAPLPCAGAPRDRRAAGVRRTAAGVRDAPGSRCTTGLSPPTPATAELTVYRPQHARRRGDRRCDRQPDRTRLRQQRRHRDRRGHRRDTRQRPIAAAGGGRQRAAAAALFSGICRERRPAGEVLPFAFCLLPFAFCLLPFAFRLSPCLSLSPDNDSEMLPRGWRE